MLKTQGCNYVLVEQLNKALPTKKPTVLMWDINANNLTDNKKLEHLLLAYGITQMRLHHTKIPSKSSKSIKWICTNINTELINTYVISSGLFRPFNIIISTPKDNTNKVKWERELLLNNILARGSHSPYTG